MLDEPQRTHTNLRRTLMVTASLVVATFAWFLVGESENAIAEERASADSSTVLATVGGEPITEDEVMEAAAAQLMQLERQKHEALTQALDTKIRERMVELEAAERGISSEELVEQEVKKRADGLAEEKIDEFWQQNQGRIRGTREQLEPQIRQYLAQSSFYDELQAKYEVERMMEPFRATVAAVGPSYGPEDAPVTIVEFSDFECPYCQRVNPALQKVKENYGDKVRIVFRQFPLAMHPNAPKAAEASLCAWDQGKFWEMHDAMFGDQKNLGVAALKQKVEGIEGIDAAKFGECLDSGKYEDQVQADMEAGSAAGVSGTPAFFVNGRFLNGAQPYDAFAEVIDEELERAGAGS